MSQFITETNCKKNGGTWTKFVTNYIERTAGVLSTCKDEGNMKLTYGRPYEPHKISQGAEVLEQYLLLQEPPKVAFASSTVVNHNGMSMDGKFSTFKWRIPAFPSNVTQRCVLRIRWDTIKQFFLCYAVHIPCSLNWIGLSRAIQWIGRDNTDVGLRIPSSLFTLSKWKHGKFSGKYPHCLLHSIFFSFWFRDDAFSFRYNITTDDVPREFTAKDNNK